MILDKEINAKEDEIIKFSNGASVVIDKVINFNLKIILKNRFLLNLFVDQN